MGFVHEEELSHYGLALRMAGATVHRYATFGSYQGPWMATVTLPDGRTGIIRGYYGSCSGCDAFEAELGYDYHDCNGSTHGEKVPGCSECADYGRRLREFGAAYFKDLMTPAELFTDVVQNQPDYGDEMVALIQGWKLQGSAHQAFRVLAGYDSQTV